MFDDVDYKPLAKPSIGADLRAPLYDALKRHDQAGPTQTAGVLYPIACVALEVTQKCNLDCTLCYLSELSEIVKDPPLKELKRRIDRIYAHYGPHTNIQITGGDPTLRNPDDLEELVRYIKSLSMRSAMFTNGIKAPRELLKRLSRAGLNDVAFHVDLTQERKGYETEMSMNTIRDAYIKKASGLGLRIHFNTTLHDENLAELPALAEYFASRAGDVYLASFQMQADTGRGTMGARAEDALTQERVIRDIEAGLNTTIGFGAIQTGHSECNRYAAAVFTGKGATPIFDAPDVFGPLYGALGAIGKDWNNPISFFKVAATLVLKDRFFAKAAFGYLVKRGALIAKHMLQYRRKPRHLAFFLHNFMDANNLDAARCESCVFMVATANGPLSMCAHNARRDTFIAPDLSNEILQETPRKHLKGRSRAYADHLHQMEKKIHEKQ